MRGASLLAVLLLTASASAQDLIIAEHGSAGLTPSMKFSYVTRYTSELQFVREELSYPLIGGSPSAALAVGDVLYVGEGNRVVRHDPTGEVHAVGPTLAGAPKSIRLSRAGELVVTTITEVVRIDPDRGTTLGRFPFFGDATDADVDPRNGCRAAIGLFPTSVLFADICSLTIEKSIDAPYVWGLRFTRGGDLLVSGRTLARYDNDGNLVRTYDGGGNCKIEIVPDGATAILACGIDFLRLDLATGVATSAGRMQRGIWADSIAFVQFVPARRRAAAR